ncbi:triose-phosphate isomerase [Aquicella lusitana]|uniref:Triosephosphate isomerase n=1 Tax=Aquicella lusitana TaxID=254246 RepID=A0A370GTW8_9COXI|nr:triose-phosphate isomerase [Aquicella lusitana]RDI46931.1 triosephosphate isomerase [Aquicella lusitana]VVC73822.1 Triosephosphate isomerase [Aquicella lusitana]
MRKPLIAGNWKMHGSKSQVKALIEGIKQGADGFAEIDILVLPTFVHLAEAKTLLDASAIMLGAQNLYPGTQGAFTGEVAGPMLADLGCDYVLIGHSERRTLFHEDLALIAAKFKAAIEAGLKPILCVGETRDQREHGETVRVISEQIQSVIEAAGIEAFRQAVIAYEPVWAIGTGLTATPEQAQEVHAYIRQLLSQINVDIGKTIRILYGGSMKAENASSLLAMADIDGGLIGGASLDAASFLKICAAAMPMDNSVQKAKVN